MEQQLALMKFTQRCVIENIIANSTFLRHRRTGLLRKSNPPLYRTGADLLIGHTGLGNSPNTS